MFCHMLNLNCQCRKSLERLGEVVDLLYRLYLIICYFPLRATEGCTLGDRIYGLCFYPALVGHSESIVTGQRILAQDKKVLRDLFNV